MANGPYDIRPQLVALYYGDLATGVPAILAYGSAYMAAWCARRQIMFREEVFQCAVAHGLLRLCKPAIAGSVEARAKQCRIRAGNFRLLSDASRDVFRTRLAEGASAFFMVAAESEDPAPSGTLLSPRADATWWSRVEAGRRNRVKLIELEVGSSHRPPASVPPRVPPRDNGWLPVFDWAA